MRTEVDLKIAVVIPNLNGKSSIAACIESLLNQTLKPEIVVVENGSTDGSLEFISKQYPNITVLPQKKNYGFAGGVNIGINYTINKGYEFVALLNNDAIADKQWLNDLYIKMAERPTVGITTSKILNSSGNHIDSTGDFFTIWGLPYPRGRDEPVSNKYDKLVEVFAGSGGASLYRISMLKKIGLFDESFFAYYEDVDISFRAQLAGWKVEYVPSSIVYHQIGATSGKIKGFTTYQTMKNLPMLFWKNVPRRLLPSMFPRFFLAYTSFYFSAILRGQGLVATKGLFRFLLLVVPKTIQRFKIQSTKKVSSDHIYSILVKDLPPNALKLKKLRKIWHGLAGDQKEVL